MGRMIVYVMVGVAAAVVVHRVASGVGQVFRKPQVGSVMVAPSPGML